MGAKIGKTKTASLQEVRTRSQDMLKVNVQGQVAGNQKESRSLRFKKLEPRLFWQKKNFDCFEQLFQGFFVRP